jgi:hypothetical protein
MARNEILGKGDWAIASKKVEDLIGEADISANAFLGTTTPPSDGDQYRHNQSQLHINLTLLIYL